MVRDSNHHIRSTGRRSPLSYNPHAGVVYASEPGSTKVYHRAGARQYPRYDGRADLGPRVARAPVG